MNRCGDHIEASGCKVAGGDEADGREGKMGEEVGKARALTPTEYRQAMILAGLLHRGEFINTDQLGR